MTCAPFMLLPEAKALADTGCGSACEHTTAVLGGATAVAVEVVADAGGAGTTAGGDGAAATANDRIMKKKQLRQMAG